MSDQDSTAPDPEIIAVIAAAIAAVLPEPHIIREVKKIQLPPVHVNVWAFEGRVELTHSHRFR